MKMLNAKIQIDIDGEIVFSDELKYKISEQVTIADFVEQVEKFSAPFREAKNARDEHERCVKLFDRINHILQAD